MGGQMASRCYIARPDPVRSLTPFARSLEAEMLVEDRAEKFECARVHRLAEQTRDARSFLHRGRPFHRRFAHDVVTQRSEWREEREIERRLARLERIYHRTHKRTS